jgi:REP element-mobilizing transposase RayT
MVFALKTVFVRILKEVRTGYQFSLVGHVRMPEHVHLLRKTQHLTVPTHASMAREQSGPMRFWQRRFYDFNV